MSFTYTPAGKRATMVDGTGKTSCTYDDTPFPFDGRQVVLPRPRVRTVDKHREVSLPLVKQLQSLDPMTERVVEQILLGVSTRGYEQSLGPTTAVSLRQRCLTGPSAARA